MKTASVTTNVVTLASTLFNFASSDLEGAQKVTILPTSASLFIGYSPTAPTATFGIPVTSGVSYTVTGIANVANLKVISQSTVAASVFAQIEK